MTDLVKLIHVSRNEAAAGGFASAELHRRLGAVGVRKIQVNLDDAAVAAAQLRKGEPPIRGVVSTWTEGAPDEVSRLLSEVDGDVAGWRVEQERIPLVPPSAADGERVDAFSQIAFLRRPDTLSREEWLSRWIGSHSQVAIDLQSTFGYVQNVIADRLTENATPVAAIVEELFPMAAMTDWHVFYDTGGDPAELERRMSRMQRSVDSFGGREAIEVVPTSRYLYDPSR